MSLPVSRWGTSVRGGGGVEFGADEVGTEEQRSAQVPPVKVLPDEVSTCEATLPRGLASNELARAQQQGVHVTPVSAVVQVHERVGTLRSQTLDLLEHQLQLDVERPSWPQRQRLAEVPEQFVEVAHDPEHLEHLRSQARRPAPVLAWGR